MFPVSTSVANWFVVTTKNLKVSNLTAALEGFRNFGIIGPRLKADSIEKDSFLSDAPDTLFLRDLTSLQISSTQVTFEKDALSLAFKYIFFKFTCGSRFRPFSYTDSNRRVLFLQRRMKFPLGPNIGRAIFRIATLNCFWDED